MRRKSLSEIIRLQRLFIITQQRRQWQQQTDLIFPRKSCHVCFSTNASSFSSSSSTSSSPSSSPLPSFPRKNIDNDDDDDDDDDNSNGYNSLFHSILHTNIGSMDAEDWEDAKILLKHCCTTDSEYGVDHSFQILDRLSNEVQHNANTNDDDNNNNNNHDDDDNDDDGGFSKNSNYSNNKKLLNFVISNWKARFIKHIQQQSNQQTMMTTTKTTTPSIPLPRDVFDKLTSWKSKSFLKPDATSFLMVLDAISYHMQMDPNKEGPILADSILEYMLNGSTSTINMQPNVACFAAVMNAWINSGDKDAPKMVQKWVQKLSELHEEGWPDMQPNLVIYNTLLKAWAKSDGMEQAEKILHDMLESRVYVTPDNISFTTLLSAYSNRGNKDSAEKAEKLLMQMHQLYDAGLEFAKPNTISYTSVIHAHANAGQAQRAEKLLQKLESLFQSTEDPDWMPDEAAYNAAILGWARILQPERADSLLHSMYENGYVKPNERSFNAVLTAWAKVGEADKAELILTRMHELFVAGEIESRPTVVTYNIVLDAWAKSKRQDAWKRAKEIFNHMEVISNKGDPSVTPNVRTWNTLLNCARKTGKAREALEMAEKFSIAARNGQVDTKPNAGTWNAVLAACLQEKNIGLAKKVLRQMKENDIEPDIVSYNTLLTIYARYHAKSDDQRRRVSTELNTIIREIDNSKHVMPNKITCLSLVNAWVKIGHVKRAEQFLNERCARYATGDQFLPDRELYHKILTGWGDQKAPKEAEDLLLKMVELQKNYKYDELGPNIGTYNRLLSAWAKSGQPGSGDRAESILRQMQNLAAVGELHTSPDIISYNSVLNAWANSGSPIASTQVEHLILEMILKGNPDLVPDNVSYGTWLKTIEASGDDDDKARRIKEVQKTMKIHNFEPSKYIVEKMQSLNAKKDKS